MLGTRSDQPLCYIMEATSRGIIQWVAMPAKGDAVPVNIIYRYPDCEMTFSGIKEPFHRIFRTVCECHILEPRMLHPVLSCILCKWEILNLVVGDVIAALEQQRKAGLGREDLSWFEGDMVVRNTSFHYAARCQTEKCEKLHHR